MENIKALFLDFDGTIIDSEWLHYQAWVEAIGPLGLTFSFEEYDARLTGQTDKRAAVMFLEMAGRPATTEAREALRATKRQIFRARNRQELRLGEGIVDAVAHLAASLPVALVTSSVRPEVEPILRDQGLFGHLLFQVCGDDVSHHKPHPEPYQLALARLHETNPSIVAADVLVLEDSDAGMGSASAVGLGVRRVSSPADTPVILAELAAAPARR